MEVKILGGVREYGRACFLVKTPKTTLLLDCGLMKGEDIPDTLKYPILDTKLAQTIDKVLITHSHEDHWGGLVRLQNLGFGGKVYCTAETIKQIKCIVDRKNIELNLDLVALEEVGNNARWWCDEQLEVAWGPSGHGRGAIWFLLKCTGKSLFYSGDYCMESRLWQNTLPSNELINLAIIDNGYGTSNGTQEEALEVLREHIARSMARGGRSMLPVPKVGRSQELLLEVLMYFKEIPIYVDVTIYNELIEALEEDRAACKQVDKYLHLIKTRPNLCIVHHIKQWEAISDQKCILLVAGGMLESLEAQTVYQMLGAQDIIILTGNQAKGTLGWRMLNDHIAKKSSPSCQYVRYNVHLGALQVCQLLDHLAINKVVLYHGAMSYAEDNKKLFRDRQRERLLDVCIGDTLKI